jgi:hypothetical protein
MYSVVAVIVEVMVVVILVDSMDFVLNMLYFDP